jgi:hypothetical protein
VNEDLTTEYTEEYKGLSSENLTVFLRELSFGTPKHRIPPPPKTLCLCVGLFFKKFLDITPFGDILNVEMI